MDSPHPLPVTVCELAERDHHRDRRRYAHVFHRSRGICVARSFYRLPPWHQWGILAHEVGHLLAGESSTEEDADRFAQDFFHITISYTSTEHGQDLQTVSQKDAMKIRQQPFRFSSSV